MSTAGGLGRCGWGGRRGLEDMEITEVRIKLVENAAERLLAFCSITIDAAFVVRDLKIIGGPNGPFVAMPSRKLCSHCLACGYKNPFKASYCNHCGVKLVEGQPPRDGEGRIRLYADIAHPINAACRDMIQKRVVREYEAELIRAREPGYVSRYEGIGDEEHRPPRG
jgi:stage V sporulation protein G